MYKQGSLGYKKTSTAIESGSFFIHDCLCIQFVGGLLAN